MEPKKDNRKRNWTFLIYPESAPENWEDVLKGLKIPCLVSPLHDKDVFTKDDEMKDPSHKAGTLKKPHYHVMLLYQGKKSYEQVKEAISPLNGTRPEAVESTGGMAAYLSHENETDKVKYDRNDVKAFNGASYAATMASNKEYKGIIIGEMVDWCDENNVYAYCDLLRYARHENPDWYYVLNTSSTNQMLAFLKSKAWQDKLTNNQ